MVLLLAVCLLLLALPLIGLLAAGWSVAPYLVFPNPTVHVAHAASYPALSLLSSAAALVLIVGLVFIAGSGKKKAGTGHICSMPVIAGITALLLFWHLAWSRYSWFAPLQEHTFFPLWFSYILLVNGLVFSRTGSCMLLRAPVRFVLLFLASSLFWWMFEYLNRFVQNWHYLLPRVYTPLGYAAYATLSFSTVLPAVAGTAELLESFDFFSRRTFRIEFIHPRRTAAIVLVSAMLGLALLPLFPDWLFPLLWLGPLALIWSAQYLTVHSAPFGEAAEGNWQEILTWASAALVCGFFWEMWNYYSLAKWIYTVPFVASYKLFEMPIPGYLGYLPFGLECAFVCRLLFGDRL